MGLVPNFQCPVDALIERGTEFRIDQRPVDAQHPVEIGRTEYHDAPIGHGPSFGRDAAHVGDGRAGHRLRGFARDATSIILSWECMMAGAGPSGTRRGDDC